MPHTLILPTYADDRGSLTVVDNILPFQIKRAYYMYNVTDTRGGHRHKKTVQAVIAVSGSCDIYVNDSKTEQTFSLNTPDTCLILQPEDWHTMQNFSANCVLLVLASESYDKDDYICEEYT